jgi:pimeloyl-ACP methyl ester carboxylesterase
LCVPLEAKQPHIETHTVQLLHANIKLEYAVHGRHGSTIPIVALHGFIDTYYSYVLLMQNLEDYRIYAPSLPCFGESDKDTDIAGDYTRLAQVVVEFMDQLDIEKAVIIGHSMSSLLAPQIAYLYPDRVHAFILLGPKATFAGDTPVLDYFDMIEETAGTNNLGPDDLFPEQFVQDVQESSAFGLSSIPSWFLERVISDAKKVPSKCWLAGIQAMRDASFIPTLSQIFKSSLILYGDHDIFAWDAEVGGPEALVVNLPETQLNKLYNIGHAPHWENPSKTAHLIRVFLKSL